MNRIRCMVAIYNQYISLYVDKCVIGFMLAALSIFNQIYVWVLYIQGSIYCVIGFTCRSNFSTNQYMHIYTVYNVYPYTLFTHAQLHTCTHLHTPTHTSTHTSTHTHTVQQHLPICIFLFTTTSRILLILRPQRYHQHSLTEYVLLSSDSDNTFS